MSHAWVASTCTESRILQKQDAGYARCVRWILRNDTDPEAIGSAIRFAGAVPMQLRSLFSALEACSGSTRELYMGDRAYFSWRRGMT